MTGPFGEGEPLVVHRPGVLPGEEDLRLALEAAKADAATLTVLTAVCSPTAAFSRRDTLLPGHAAAAETAAAHGYEVAIRPVGGHLVGYDEGSVVAHVWGPHPSPRDFLRRRFVLAAEALVAAMTELGVPDARVGSVPGEYCEGEWSVNAGGTSKLVGTGQRMFRGGVLFSAVATVARPEPLRAMLTAAYADLALDLDPATVGSVDAWVPGVSLDEARVVIARHLAHATTVPSGTDATTMAPRPSRTPL